MGLLGDIVDRLTGRKPEQQQAPRPPAPSAAGGPPSWEKPTPLPKYLQNVPLHPGPGPSPTARLLDKYPDVKELGKQVYNGQVEPTPGPLAKEKPTKKEHVFQPPGTHPGSTIGGMCMGGGGRPIRAAPQTPAPPPPPPPRRPPVKSFEEFIGGTDRGIDR